MKYDILIANDVETERAGKIRKKISVENDELDCLTAMCYMGTGKYSKANSMLEKLEKDATGSYPFASFFYRRAMKQQETDTMEEEKMKKRAKKIVALFLTAGILLSGTAACSNVEACIFQDRQGN